MNNQAKVRLYSGRASPASLSSSIDLGQPASQHAPAAGAGGRGQGEPCIGHTLCINASLHIHTCIHAHKEGSYL